MFNPENDLEQALVRAAEEPAHRVAFLTAFLDAELSLALVDSGDAKDGYVVPEVTQDDLAFVPVFTSDGRVKAMFGDEKLMIVRQTFRQILEQLDDANFVLNPGSDYGREFTSGDVAAMLDGHFERAAEGFDEEPGDEGGEVPTLVGKPSPMPTHLTAPLAAMFATIPEVRAAHIAQALFADEEGVKRLVIGLSADGDIDAVFDRIGDVLEEAAKPTDVIDFVSVPGSPLDGYFERDVQPFYRKG
ncbi:MAG TPA: enhanced serine sensitivity protein SseB C-terminal domain-containing protein [Hansschlegelia sp.]